MIRRVVLLLSMFVLLATPTFAKRSKVPALEAGTIRAEPKADAAAVLEIKKGDNLLVLGKQGDWSQVLTDGGKKGWILSKVVSAGGLADLDPNATTVAAMEGDTAIAMRGRPSPPRTLIVSMGGMKGDAAKKLGEIVKSERKLKLLEVREEAATKTGLDGAKELAGAQEADLVVALQSAPGDALTYEFVDLKHKAVLGGGTTTTKEPAKEVAAALAKATEELLKNPAVSAAKPAALPEVTPAAAVPTATAEEAKKTGVGIPKGLAPKSKIRK